MADSFASRVSAKIIREAIAEALNSGSIAALITVIQSETLNVGAKLFIAANGETLGDLGDAALNHAVFEKRGEFLRTRAEATTWRTREFAPELAQLSESVLMFERIETEPQMVIAGAGHVGAALARLAALVGYRVKLVDDRAEFVAREMFASQLESPIELITAVSWDDAIHDAVGSGRGVSMAIVTRGHKQDEECLRAALAAGPDYIGMIGSKRRTNIVLDKLREEGFDAEQLEKVRAPIGLDIGAVSPEEVALAILAEIVAERRGGAGGSLSVWRRA
ncbi:MAG TPA: XdhC family protein [Pyrinomonadaceae bacterium]|nr:XdhC family protein [Pyrinomonadaceae bacterium]